MNPALAFVAGGAFTVELAMPLNTNVRVFPPPPKVALLAPPLAENPPVVEYVIASASAGVAISNASADKVSTKQTPETFRVISLSPFLAVSGLKRLVNFR